MRRICFICLGNICRSPMAEFIMKDLLKKNDMDDRIIASKAISYEEDGNDMDRRAKQTLEENGIPYQKHRATRIEKKDKEKYDDFIVMEDYQISYVKDIIGECNVYKLQNYDIEDPWYTNNFQKVYEEILDGCRKILKK